MNLPFLLSLFYRQKWRSTVVVVVVEREKLGNLVWADGCIISSFSVSVYLSHTFTWRKKGKETFFGCFSFISFLVCLSLSLPSTKPHHAVKSILSISSFPFISHGFFCNACEIHEYRETLWGLWGLLCADSCRQEREGIVSGPVWKVKVGDKKREVRVDPLIPQSIPPFFHSQNTTRETCNNNQCISLNSSLLPLWKRERQTTTRHWKVSQQLFSHLLLSSGHAWGPSFLSFLHSFLFLSRFSFSVSTRGRRGEIEGHHHHHSHHPSFLPTSPHGTLSFLPSDGVDGWYSFSSISRCCVFVVVAHPVLPDSLSLDKGERLNPFHNPLHSLPCFEKVFSPLDLRLSSRRVAIRWRENGKRIDETWVALSLTVMEWLARDERGLSDRRKGNSQLCEWKD